MKKPEVNINSVRGIHEARRAPREIVERLGHELPDTNYFLLQLVDGAVYAMKKDHPKYPGWRELLRESMHGEPVYVETEPGTRQVKSLLVPLPKRVQHISKRLKDGRLNVILFLCPSVCYLDEKLSKEKFKRFRKLLEVSLRTKSEVLVTTRPSTMEILDVRPVEDDQSGHDQEAKGPADQQIVLKARHITLHSGAISLAQATAEFNHLANEAQIPFDYVRDCCTARAHEMCRIMRYDGLQPRKVWNYGHGWASPNKSATLRVVTNKVPEGFVTWCYHVAPIIAVRVSAGTIRQMVMDPAVFTRPVTIAEWVAIQEDTSSLQRRKISRFIWFDYLTGEDITDPRFVLTNRQFRHHRAAANDARH
jgi:hypothetical protein